MKHTWILFSLLVVVACEPAIISSSPGYSIPATYSSHFMMSLDRPDEPGSKIAIWLKNKPNRIDQLPVINGDRAKTAILMRGDIDASDGTRSDWVLEVWMNTVVKPDEEVRLRIDGLEHAYVLKSTESKRRGLSNRVFRVTPSSPTSRIELQLEREAELDARNGTIIPEWANVYIIGQRNGDPVAVAMLVKRVQHESSRRKVALANEYAHY